MSPRAHRTLSAALVAATTFAACGGKPGQSAGGSPKPGAAEAKGEAGGEHHDEMPETVRLGSAAIAEAGVQTWTVQPVDLEHLLVLNATVEHNENRLLQVAANVQGRVAAIPVDLGAKVERGDPLLVLESVALGRAREEFLREMAALRVANRAYERARALVAGKAISEGEFQAREGEYLAKRAAAQAAERALHLHGEDDDEIARLRKAAESDGALPSGDPPRLTLRAPFAGRVIDRKVTPGALVEALQPLMTLADLSTVWVFLQAYEKDLALLSKGLPVTIRSEAYAQDTFKGRVDFLGSVVDEATRTVKLRATVDNHDERLRPGMFVKAQVDVPKPEAEAKTILAVPQSALQTLEGRTTLFIQLQPGVFARRFVETGHTFEGFTEVLAGVKPGDVVVTEGSFVLKSEFAKASLAEEH
jgi:cobalt-zinc-cadmium efflux system membrane fusion protein